ncbi:MAG: endolytic transglycosylase MltG, partial [Bryobacteraceae bacterium]|nr:endolytic transglycosylase MltG [Bryobacteraceae bacterium]
KGMRMDADPTVIYAALLENRYRGSIYRSDLDKDHPYNTYRHAGLPPGPIANPGRGALEAALRPAETEFLFFVAKPDGSGAHEFTTDLTEHNKAVLNYRRGAPQP